MKITLNMLAFLLLASSTLPAQVIDIDGATTRAVVIGISDYQDPGIPDLRFADRDAEAFANFLRSPAGGSLDGDHLKVLIDSQATMAQFAIALDWLMEVTKEGDQAVIYFSGHGDVEKKTLTQPGFLLCWDAPSRVYMAGGAFNLRDVQEIVSTLSIQNKAKVVVITDACRSGTLAGQSVGGAQATAANLAKQFANEIKILSCQPNEYSIEGEQWGGGRGAFSFNLIDALYGMADANKDLSVNLKEVGRYLEDHVAAEVAPVSQNPKVVGDPNERLASVDAKLLAELRSGKTTQMKMLSAIESRGMEDDVLAGVDTTVRELYQMFKKALKDKVFLVPNAGEPSASGGCANAYYERLIAEPKLGRLHSTMRRNYAAALQDDAQQIINQVLRTDPQILDDAFSPVSKYDHLPAQLKRAGELLGEGHYMYRVIKAREYYFRAKACRKENYPKLAPDSLLKMALAKLDTALTFDSEAAYLHFEIGVLYCRDYQNRKKALPHLDQAIQLSPEWLLANFFKGFALGNETGEGKKYFRKCIMLDPSFLPPYNWLIHPINFFTPEAKSLLEDYVVQLNKYIQEHPGKVPIQYYKELGSTLKHLGRYEEAIKIYTVIAEFSDPKDSRPYYTFYQLYLDLGKIEDAEKSLQKAIELEPHNLLWQESYVTFKFYYQQKPFEEMVPLFKEVIEQWEGNTWAVEDLCFIYFHNNQWDSAEALVKKYLLVLDDSGRQRAMRLGQIYKANGMKEAAKEQFELVCTLPKTDSEWTYELLEQYFKIIVNYHLESGDSIPAILEQVRQTAGDRLELYFFNACALAVIGQNDLALQCLEEAFKKGWKPRSSSTFISLVNNDLYYLRQTPKYKALIRKYLPDQTKD